MCRHPILVFHLTLRYYTLVLLIYRGHGSPVAPVSLCARHQTWLAARRSPCQGPGGLCSVKGSIAGFTKQAKQTATRFLIYAGTGTGGVALACHSGVSIHCCLAAKVLLLLGIHETALYLQKSEKEGRMTGGQHAGEHCSINVRDLIKNLK